VRQFSLMLVPDSGPIQSYRIRKSWVWLSLLVLCTLMVLGVWGVYSVYQARSLAVALQQSQATLAQVHQHQRDAYLAMQEQLDIEHEKVTTYTRNLGALQARMARLDALGKHLVKIAKLDQNTFDFDERPALGGPRMSASDDVYVQGLGVRLATMDKGLSHLDAQLAAIDAMLQDEREAKEAKPHAWPTQGGWLSSHFGMRDDPFTGLRAMHKGVDIANHLGAPVLAASRGVVVFSGKMKGFGYLIEIEHGYGYRTRYAHLSSSAVKVGDLVADGALIGRVGSVGRSTGPHLHFEVLRFGRAIDPQRFLPHV